MSPAAVSMEVEDDNTKSGNDIDFGNILQMVDRPLQKNDAWYLVDKKWYEKFEKFLVDRQPCNSPGPIDNTNLFEPLEGELREIKENLQDELDYKLVPEDAWQILCGYFGIQHKSHAIRRLVIEEGLKVSLCSVEVYPIDITFCLHGRSKSKMSHRCSRMTTLFVLVESIKQYFEIDPLLDTRLHHLNTVLDISDSITLADCGIATGHTVALEVQNENGTWAIQSCAGATTSPRKYKVGFCGLENLGNTCFMNSALQCLSNTPPLTEYILSNKYLTEINRTNPLGMEGKIAESYAELIKNMWSGKMNYYVPRNFKHIVGCFAPQFGGYAQQDSQELMAFLMDGLHEDLNRIVDKPYIENKDGVDTRPDHVIAEETWSNYRKRNDSIIIDTFHGLLKSTLVCPDCKVVSVTFDPFCFLSLPLKSQKEIDVILLPLDDRKGKLKAIKLVGLLVPKHGFISDIHKAVSYVVTNELNIGPIDPLKLVMVEGYDHRLLKIYCKDDKMVSGKRVVEVHEISGDKFSLPVYLREVISDGTKIIFWKPFFIGVEEVKYSAIYESVQKRLRTLVSHKNSDDVDCLNAPDVFTLFLTDFVGTDDHQKLDLNCSIELQSNSVIAVDLSTTTKNKFYYPERQKSAKAYPKEAKFPKSGISLSECINNFTTIEMLGENDLWYCPECKGHKQATKKFDLWQLPNVLIIHLKRFTFSRYYRDKLDALVDYPITELDMGVHVINNPDKKPILYDLIGVSNHVGNLGGGHYTAFAKNSQTQKWYYFNDSSVGEACEDELVSNRGYVLYYLRRS